MDTSPYSTIAIVMFLLWSFLIIVRNSKLHKISAWIRNYNVFQLVSKFDLFSSLREHPPGLYYRIIDKDVKINNWHRVDLLDMPFKWYHFLWTPHLLQHHVLIVCSESIVYGVKEDPVKWNTTKIMSRFEYQVLQQFFQDRVAISGNKKVQFKVVEEIYHSSGKFSVSEPFFTSPI